MPFEQPVGFLNPYSPVLIKFFIDLATVFWLAIFNLRATGFGAQQRHLALSWRLTIYENGGRRS